MEKIRLDVGYTNYDITIGQNLYDEIKRFLAGKKYSEKVLIISDSNVFPLYGEKIAKIFNEAGYIAVNYVVDAGEGAKSLAVADSIYTKAIEEHIDRKSLIIALGGGVVGDLAGFIAATYLRGVPFLQISTSLLSAVDSSVGGKVAVNHRLGKNLIGAFYQPEAVFIDTDFLKTLPKREIKTGFGEIVKYGVIMDADFIDFLEQNAEKIFDIDEELYTPIIAKSVKIKADVVSKDEREGDLRRILNFGHTVGHAVEKQTNFKVYNHGEAVAIGIIAAMKISEKLNLITNEDFIRVEKLLERLKLPIKAEGVTLEGIKRSMMSDKKTVNGKINFVLPVKIGEVIVKNDVPESVVDNAIEYVIK
ncbi:MAG: 3-dehydroquinate synthase [Selenomonadaceae bacterium]|nr:3-dehydroquinate synthase [Selenomonadaceae bacterium]